MRIAAAMSGGVNSLRTAALLCDEGHDVFGVHMDILPRPGDGGQWAEPAREREESLRKLASRLNIPMVFIDLRDFFEICVIEPFLESYRSGLTPNPCILCNPKVKFGRLLEEAIRLGAERLATGHYARLLGPDASSPRFKLCRASDSGKDQSYFLYGLRQEQLAKVLFPLGGLSKRAVAQWAGEAGFGPLLPEESQEICFIPSGHYGRFIEERATDGAGTAGPIIDMDGNRIGTHQGIFLYTIGQRRGLGIASTAPYYVVDLDPAANTVRVGRANDLNRSRLRVGGVNWVSIDPPAEPIRCSVRIRNQHRPAPAWVAPRPGGEVSVRFDEFQRAAAPGQAAVFYRDDLLLGGGVIVRDIAPAEVSSEEAP